MLSRRHLAAAACAAMLAIAAAGHASPAAGQNAVGASADRTGLPLLERPGDRFESSIEAHNRRLAERAERRAERREARLAERRAEISRLGVSEATLESIAACESGGDPAAVNSAGYYGKYQFDLQTWQSVGGSGNPAEADVVEQDYRAALLYARAGASPWPVCGS